MHFAILTSVEHNIHLPEWSLSHRDLALATDAKWSIRKFRLMGGKQDGVDVVEIDNGQLVLSIVPTRGMAIHEVRRGAIRLGWDSPVKELVHPKYIHLEDHGGIGWLEGFSEWMARCGLEFSGHPGLDHGRLLTLHGKIGNIPASEVVVSVDLQPPHRIRVRGKVAERWFNGPQLELWAEVSTVPGSASFRLNDLVTNYSDREQEFTVLYHANFGPPLLEAGSRLHGTIQKIVPFDEAAAAGLEGWHTYGEPKVNAPEAVFCMYPTADAAGKSHFLLHNAAGNMGVSFSFFKDQLPYFTQWKNENSLNNGYVTGLEPGTGFPHNRSVERKYDRVPKLGPGANRNFTITYRLHDGPEEVAAEVQRVASLQKGKVELVPSVIPK